MLIYELYLNFGQVFISFIKFPVDDCISFFLNAHLNASYIMAMTAAPLSYPNVITAL